MAARSPGPEADPGAAHAARPAGRLAALHEVLQAIAASEAPDRLVALIVERACGLLEVDRCGLFLVERRTAEATLLRARHLRGLPEEEFGQIQLGAGEGITAQVIAEQHTLWTEDILADARFPLSQEMRTLLAAHDIRGILAAPAMVGRRVLGLFYLFPEAGRSFSPDEAEFFSSLALLVGIALEAARAPAPDWATPPA